MVTVDQAKQYLQSQGIDNVPDFILSAWVDMANSIQECLDLNYPAGTAMLIQMYLLSLMALGQADKYISSQTAPSGASRSFRYGSFADRWKAQISLLRGLDKKGCSTELIPPDPTNKSHAGMWIAKGGCMGDCN